LVQDIQPVNNITFQCNGAATIIITHPHEITKTTVIDGAGNVVLDGVEESDMFVGNDSNVGLFLDNLIIRRAGKPIIPLHRGSVVKGKISLVLNHTRIESSINPIFLEDGSLNIQDSQLVENSTEVIAGSLRETSIERSQLENPKASSLFINGLGGSVRIIDSQFSNHGIVSGLIYNCTLIIERSSFSNQDVPSLGGGAFETDCNTTIAHSVFSNNHAGYGGALFFLSKVATVSLTGVKFINNSATGRGGAIGFERMSSGAGTRTLSIRHGTFIGNTAQSGGAIDDDVHDVPSGPDDGQVTLIQGMAVNFSKNSASGDGGAIRGTSMAVNISRGIFSDNQSGSSGGAIALRNFGRGLHSVFANTLFIRNRATALGGAFYGEDADLINSTVDSNLAGGVYLWASTPQAKPIRFVNSIISRNDQGNCGSTANGATFVDGGHNLQFPGNECGTSITVADPILDSMYIPIPKSPPIAHGDNDICVKTPVNRVDVYGLLRPQGSVCTIGAAEGDIQMLYNRWRDRHCGFFGAPVAPPGCNQSLQQFWSFMGLGPAPALPPSSVKY
jgi:predicted outer membrane repeat protein